MVKKQFTLIDTFDCGLEYADYVDFCEANEITPSDENSNDYYEWLGEERNRMVEDFFDNLKYCKVDTPVLIEGTLGLWNGTRSIYPMLMESTDYNIYNGKGRWDNPSVYKAVSKCVSGMDDFKVEFADGQLIVHGYHHDGTNTFTISKLSKKGIVSATNANDNGRHLEPKGYWYGKFSEIDLW